MIPFAGQVWRTIFAGADDATRPVASTEGRFHHDGQTAIYTSLTAEGCRVAIKRYVGSNEPPRIIVPLDVRLTKVVDLRGRAELSTVWQDIRATGAPAPTWAYSDAARASGAQGLLYSSRSRPDLTHLVVFSGDPDAVGVAGPALPF